MGVLTYWEGATLTASPIRIAVASSLQPAMGEIIRQFDEANGGSGLVVASYGASGKLATQVIQGAPFHLLITADLDSSRRVVTSGKARGEPVPCAVGRLILVAKGPESMGADLSDILDEGILRIALPNPEVAPNGKLAMTIMENAGILEAVRSRIVITQNVGQAAQYFMTGVVDAAWIGQSALREVQSRLEVRVLSFPEGASDQIIYPMLCLLFGTPDEHRMTDVFSDFMLSDTSQGILELYGYHHPSAL